MSTLTIADQVATLSTAARPLDAAWCDRHPTCGTVERWEVAMRVYVLGIATLVACAGTATQFNPWSSTSVQPPLTEHALRVYPGDVSTLAAAGGELVGSVEVSGNAFA
ncbi:MAG: hypothetical protein ABI867_30215, partial [Kofleriaceae bacterium]